MVWGCSWVMKLAMALGSSHLRDSRALSSTVAERLSTSSFARSPPRAFEMVLRTKSPEALMRKPSPAVPLLL